MLIHFSDRPMFLPLSDIRYLEEVGTLLDIDGNDYEAFRQVPYENFRLALITIKIFSADGVELPSGGRLRLE